MDGRSQCTVSIIFMMCTNILTSEGYGVCKDVFQNRKKQDKTAETWQPMSPRNIKNTFLFTENSSFRAH